MKTYQRISVTLLLSLSMVGATQAAGNATLYQRLGGMDALNAVVGELWNVVSRDARINTRFANTRPEIFGKQLVAFLCEASGGPCKYLGRDMKSAHTGMKLTDADFAALAEDTASVLDRFKVPAAEKDEVMRLLGRLKTDVVNY